MYHIGDTNIPAHGRQQVTYALAVGATITINANHDKLMVGNFSAGSHGESSSVKSVKNVAACIVRQLWRLPDTGHEKYLMRL